jgi:hypothetical protein
VAHKKRSKLAPVTLPVNSLETWLLSNVVQQPRGITPVGLADGRRVFVPEGSDPDAVRAQAELKGVARS